MCVKHFIHSILSFMYTICIDMQVLHTYVKHSLKVQLVKVCTHTMYACKATMNVVQACQS